jgi:hypothetical protein
MYNKTDRELNMQNWKLHNAGIQVDILGNPVKVGDKVLVKGYGSVKMDIVRTVERVNKRSISWKELDIEMYGWDSENRKYNKKLVAKNIRRIACLDCIVINSQLPVSEKEKDNFVKEHPEIFL